MLVDNEILTNFPISEIVSKFPKSGQKQALLVKHNQYGLVMLKIVDGNNERVKREIQIVSENNFRYVPQIMEVNEFDINGQKGIYIYSKSIYTVKA